MSKPLDLVFLWHMHQPDYRDYSTGDFVLPWVYLHAIKDYTDMAYHLEQHPQVKAVVNFVPILLDQLEDYEHQFATGQIRDPLLRLLARENLNDLERGGARACAGQLLPQQPHQNGRAISLLQTPVRPVQGSSNPAAMRRCPTCPDSTWPTCWSGTTWCGAAKVCAANMTCSST